MQSEENLTEGLPQETSEHSHGSNMSSDVSISRSVVDPSNHVDHNFSIILPIVSQSATIYAFQSPIKGNCTKFYSSLGNANSIFHVERLNIVIQLKHIPIIALKGKKHIISDIVVC